VKYCVNNELPGKLPTAISSRGVPTTATETQLAAIANADKVTQAIPASVAEAPLDPPVEASPLAMNRLAEAGGSTAVAEVSRSQTSGILKMAESLLASTPAVAASGSATAVATSGSTRSPSSVSSAKTKAFKSSTVGKDEYIAEEIDLTKGTSATSSAASKTNIVKTSADVEKEPTPAASSRAPANVPVVDASREVQVAQGSVGGSASNASLPSSSNSGVRRNTQARGTASTGSGSGAYAPSQDEIVSFLSQSSYNQARQKLQDDKFVGNLRDNNITVMDLAGKTYGASNGNVIFVDQGDRFVRQK
ncbi:MAG: hypothetical protein AAGB31_14445, partial [Bdellovibrio sp.]